MLSLYAHICSRPSPLWFFSHAFPPFFSIAAASGREQFWMLPKGNENAWLCVPAWGPSSLGRQLSLPLLSIPGKSPFSLMPYWALLWIVHLCLLGSRPPMRGRVTNLPSISDPSLTPRISACFCSTNMISRIPRGDHTNFLPKLSELQAFPPPTNRWKADASFSLSKKCSKESQDKVTFRLWGSPRPKHLD